VPSKSVHTTALARELLDDIELGRLSAEALVLKALRLARLIGDQPHIEWLTLELQGYYSDSGENAQDLARRLGRVTNVAQNLGHWGPLAQIEADIATNRQRLQTLRVPDVSLSISSANPNEWVTGGAWTPAPQTAASGAINAVVAEVRNVATTLSTQTGIRARALAWIHMFAVNVYHERAFSGLAESIFERYKADVDKLLAQRAGDALSKIAAINDRLAEGDTEAISQALSTGRRIIDAFADAVYPPSSRPNLVDGQEVKVGKGQVQNRLMAYVDKHVSSKGRRRKLKRALEDLYDRVSTGVHADVTAEEARALFLEVYTFLGEVLQAAPPPATQLGTPEPASPAQSISDLA
jgi:hypothetical protein